MLNIVQDTIAMFGIIKDSLEPNTDIRKHGYKTQQLIY